MVKIATLVGCAIGDALGNPFEMKAAISPALQEWDGLFKAGGTFWRGEAGQYTDDTLMSIMLSVSLLEHRGFNPEDVAKKYLAWYESGNTRGIGGTTAGAIVNLKMGVPHTQSGLTHNPDGTPVGGNGTAMRATPIGLVYRGDYNKLLQVATEDAAITHNSLEPKLASVVVALATAMLANEEYNNRQVLSEVAKIVPPDSVLADRLGKAIFCFENATPPAQALAHIGTNGYAPETTAAALYCLAATENFKDCVTMAVRGGGDTDTTAAIAGALAGTWYGEEGIPEEYHGVENRELLQGLTDRLVSISI